MADYKSGVRESCVPTRSPVVLMTSLAKDITDAEVEGSGLFPRLSRERISRSSRPMWSRKHMSPDGFFPPVAPVRRSQSVSASSRCVKILSKFENRDTRSTFIACVPVGSAAKGSALVNTGGAGGAPTVGPPERRVWRCVSTGNESHCCQSDR